VIGAVKILAEYNERDFCGTAEHITIKEEGENGASEMP
jgi:hypothetical protein